LPRKVRGDRYVKLVEWSEEDSCFIGSCPELFYGGCHGADAKAVFSELCETVEDSIQPCERDGKPLPEPMSGREFVNALQRIA
jgi:predicted RNase H-like HicB family nuclease